MDVIVIINQLIKFFIIMGIGYFLYKKEYMDSAFNKKLTNIILRVTMPCMMISSVFGVTGERDYKRVLFAFLIAVIMYASLTALGIVLAKLLRCNIDEMGIYVFMTIFGNVGFLGFPLIEAVMGKEAVFYASIFNMIFNISIFSIGVKAINYPEDTNERSKKDSIMKIVTHPGVISALLSVVLYFTGIQIPTILESTISTVGGITSPVAMLLMGASLAKIPLNRVFSDVRVYIFTVIKTILIPVISWIIIKTFIKDQFIAFVTLIMIAMPVANNSVMFAIEYDRDEEIAAKNVFISTVFSIISIPVVIYLTSVI